MPFIRDDGHSIELEPTKLRRDGPPRSILGDAMRYVRMGKKAGNRSTRPAKSYLQRCAVQVRYTKGGSVGKWYSHGAYIAREARQGLGFSETRADVPVAETLANWRKEKDELFFRIILSPEFGERLDLEKHTRDTMEQMAFDLGTKLEWTAVIHRNTDNPHVHVVVRGKRDTGEDLRISRDYIQEGLRNRAQEAATRQLGPRTEQDILTAQRREIGQSRWTGLDRLLEKRAAEYQGRLLVSVHPAESPTNAHLDRRLHRLAEMGLAESLGKDAWAIDPDWQKSLRLMQKTADRLKITAAYGVLASDPRLPFRMIRPSQLTDVEGRILVHGQDEHSGSNFLLLESIQGEVLRVPQIAEIAKARQHGRMNAGQYVRISRTSGSGDGQRAKYQIEEFGDADSLVRDTEFWRTQGARLAGQIASGWQGWLGHMHAQAKRLALAEQKAQSIHR